LYRMQNQAREKGASNRSRLKPDYPDIQIRKRRMYKIENSQADNSRNPNKMPRLSFPEELDDVESDDKSYDSKMKIECICPKCAQRHIMAFHWIGRGTPRKYCQSCKGGSNG
jgi:ribosomal protein S27AE